MITHQGVVEEARIGPIMAEHEVLEYRSRLELHVKWTNSVPTVGFMARGSRRTIDIDYCLLALPLLNALLPGVHKLLTATGAEGVARMELACDAPGEGTSIVIWASGRLPKRMRDVLHLHTDDLPGTRGIFHANRRDTSLLPLREQNEATRGVLTSVPATDGVEDLILEVWPGVFNQVNPAVNRLLIETASGWIRKEPPETMLDLYAGMRNLTLTLGVFAKKVMAVEVNPLAVENARVNAKRHSIDHVQWMQGSAKRCLQTLIAKGERFDLLVLDPPRSGAIEILSGILALAPPWILYVSCDPATLTRDLRFLKENGSYEVARTQALDMFPQTYHLESITLLEKRK
jgi:23S rRNA (uracil1939-C5)-methyltransferase